MAMNDFFRILIAAVFLLRFALAAEPTPLIWDLDNVGGIALKKGHLIFCQSGDVFGYIDSKNPTNCGDPAPLIRMTAGETYHLVLQNDSTETTNLHTHGLHIPGNDSGDDVTRTVDPGMCLTYVYKIPGYHSDGTNWYHPHHHGQTDPQVDGGAFGMLIIDSDVPSNKPESVQYFTSAANEKILLLSDNHEQGRRANGETSEDMLLIENEWYHLRVSCSDPTGDCDEVTFDESRCQVHMVAYDGVWRSQVPRLDQTFTVYPSGSSRFDVAIKCTGGTNPAGIWFGNPNQDPIVRLHVFSSIPTTSASPFQDEATLQQWEPDQPNYLQDVSNEPDPPQDRYFEIKMSAAKISGYDWDINNPVDYYPPLDEVQEWDILDSANHPFHLHMYHMQVMTPEGCGDFHEYLQYYDTIQAGSCKVRFRPVDISGRTVMHCHVLGHEDNGAMTWMDFDGPNSPPTPDDYYCQHVCGDIPSGCGGGSTGSPTTSPVGGPTGCANVGEFCQDDGDCCSESCHENSNVCKD